MQDFITLMKKTLSANKYDDKEIEDIWHIIKDIFKHEEFQKRLNTHVFCHHGKVSLGEHILNDAIISYKLAKKKKEQINIRLAVIIAMFHDLYELPWQNQKRKYERFSNKHGFVHPIEAIINAITWFPEFFSQDANIIIDGVIHHMYPFPVRVFDDSNLNLNNLEKYNNLKEEFKLMIRNSTHRKRIGRLSFAKSFSLEGRIASKADKLSILKRERLSLCDYIALVTGKNSKLNKK